MKKIIVFLFSIIIFTAPFSVEAFEIAVVSDLHIGDKGCTSYKCGARAKRAFQEVLDNTGYMPIISAGDNTNTGDRKAKIRLLSQTAGRTVLWANGNHDKETYLSGKEYYSYDKENWRIIIIHTTAIKEDSNQFAWLTNQLNTDKKKMVVMHHPIFNNSSHNVIDGYKKLEQLFKTSGVKYVLSGHWHGDNWTRVYNGVTYKALHGLTYDGGVHYEVMNLD